MDPAVIFLAVLIIVLVSGGITLTVSAIRRSGITQLARKPLLDSGQHVAQDLLSRVGIGMSSGAGDLLDRMEDVGALVTPEYLDQLVDESDDALHTVTTALQPLERELAAA